MTLPQLRPRPLICGRGRSSKQLFTNAQKSDWRAAIGERVTGKQSADSGALCKNDNMFEYYSYLVKSLYYFKNFRETLDTASEFSYPLSVIRAGLNTRII